MEKIVFLREFMQAKEKTKIIQTTLDSLPFGSVEDLPKEGSKFHKQPLPENVTRAQLTRDTVRIAWPSFLELVLTQLTSMADQIMVGQLSGAAGIMALSAVGLSGQPKMLLMTMVQALNVGSTAMVARFRGQGDRQKANQVFRQSLLFNILLSILMMVLGVIFTGPLLTLIGGQGISAETYKYAAEYFRIQMYGFVPLCITITFTAVLRGIGDTKTPLIYNTLANVINLIFNYLLIYGKFGFPRMEVAGASLATVIGQTCAFVIALISVMNKKRFVYLSFREKFKLDFTILGNVVSIGIPSMIEQMFMRAGVILFTRTITGLGDTMYATHQICMNIQAMSFMTGQAFSNSATTLMGQSLGKRRYDMADNYTRCTRRIGLYTSLVLAACLILFGRTIVSFYNSTPEVIALGGNILFMVAFMQPFQSSQFITAGALRGAGDTRYTAICIFITVLVVRAGLAYIFVTLLDFGLWGAWIALVCDQLLRSLLIVLHYRSGKWRFVKLKGQNA